MTQDKYTLKIKIANRLHILTAQAFLFCFIVVQFLHLHQTLGTQSFLSNMSRFIASPPSLLYHGRIFYDWIYSILAQIGNLYLYFLKPLHKKWSFPLRISSVNVAKSTVLVTLTEEILNGKPHFCAVNHIYTNQEKCKRITCGKQWIYKIFSKVYCAEGFLLPYTHPILYPKCIVNEIQSTAKPNKLYIMTVYRHDLHNGVMASCHNLVKVLSTEFLWYG